MSGEDDYKDLINFLKSDRADLRQAASDAILQVNEPRGMATLIKYGAVKPLCRLASMTNEASSLIALESLLQLSSHGISIHQCIEDLLNCGGINRMAEIALQPVKDQKWRKRVNYSLALLVNMTRTERGAVELCGYSMPETPVPISSVQESETIELKVDLQMPSKPIMSLLTANFLFKGHIEEFIKDNIEECQDDTEEIINSQIIDDNILISNDLEAENMSASTHDPFQHFSAVLMNATQVEQGRRFVMKIHYENIEAKGLSILQRLLPELRSKNLLRRRGIAGIIKNCCFDKDSVWWLMNEVDIVPKILYPLAGPEELDIDEKQGMDPDLWLEGPDKVREKDQLTRMLLVESILLLCTGGRKPRTQIRLHKAYIILKMLDLVEESEEISEKINECVQYLRRDEEGTPEGSSDLMVSEAFGGSISPLSPTSKKDVDGSKDMNFDNVD